MPCCLWGLQRRRASLPGGLGAVPPEPLTWAGRRMPCCLWGLQRGRASLPGGLEACAPKNHLPRRGGGCLVVYGDCKDAEPPCLGVWRLVPPRTTYLGGEEDALLSMGIAKTQSLLAWGLGGLCPQEPLTWAGGWDQSLRLSDADPCRGSRGKHPSGRELGGSSPQLPARGRGPN